MADYFDIHSHLLFGVDDGPDTVEESMILLQQAYDDGIRTLYLTPHYRRELFDCSLERCVQNFALLKDRAKRRFPDLTLRLGAEVYVTMDAVQDIRSNQCLTLGNSECILLEFPESAKSGYFIERCHAVLNAGYIPIIAHAERCIAIRKDLELLQRLVNMGVYIQMNAGSIVGEEGILQKWFCKKAMKRNLLHFIGSDAHDSRKRRPNLNKCMQYLARTMGTQYGEQILRINPREIIEGSV